MSTIARIAADQRGLRLRLAIKSTATNAPAHTSTTSQLPTRAYGVAPV
jgi:hypothetical protein